jgi:hypothetical protein
MDNVHSLQVPISSRHKENLWRAEVTTHFERVFSSTLVSFGMEKERVLGGREGDPSSTNESDTGGGTGQVSPGGVSKPGSEDRGRPIMLIW